MGPWSHLVHTDIIWIITVNGVTGLLQWRLLILCWKCYVLLTDLHLFVCPFVQAYGTSRTRPGIASCIALLDVAISPLDLLAIRFGRLWDRIIGTFRRSWMAGRPRWRPTTSFLLRKCLRLAGAHYVLRDIDQVSFPVFLHGSTQLLRGASMRRILIRTIDLPTYIGADYRTLSCIVVHELFASVVFYSYKVFSFLAIVCLILSLLIVLSGYLCVLEAPILSACPNIISLVRLTTRHGDRSL